MRIYPYARIRICMVHLCAVMWEWRIFLHVPRSGLDDEAELPDIWRLLDSKPWNSYPEVRTDVYFACSPRSGVKFRSGRNLEVKMRSEMHESGAEKWDKVTYRSYGSVRPRSPPPPARNYYNS